MGMHRGLRHAWALCATGAVAAAVSCLDPTEVTLVITTDVQCSLDRGTSITVGNTSEDLSSKPALTVTQDCTSASQSVDDSGALTSPANIGTLVVVPSGSKSDSFAVRVVMAVDPNMSPMDCVPPAYTNCIVADREVSFIPHTPITLPIEITVDCKNIVCSKGLTCVHGQCASEVVHVDCPNGDCTGTIPPDAATKPPESDASPDVSMEPPTQDAPSSDQLVDQTLAEMDTDVQGNDGTLDDAADATGMDVTSTDGMPDGPPDSTAQDASMIDSSLDAVPDTADASLADASDGSVADAADVSVADAPHDVSTGDVGTETGTVADAGADADAGQPSDGGSPGDGNVIGACPAPNSNGGVVCNGGHCASGKVCCVNIPMFSAVTETCEDFSACNVSAPTYPLNWALACRNAGDCPSGTVCCFQGAEAGAGVVTTCATSCPASGLAVVPKTACQNSCECSGLAPVCNPVTCSGATYGVCGGTAGGSFCP
jgi:hypothetical protein